MKKVILFFVVLVSLYGEENVPTIIKSPRQNYTVISPLGAGCFGEVYLVADPEGNQFAIKSLRVKMLDGVPFKSLYNDAVREFERGQAMQHPNVVKILDIFTSPEEDLVTYLLLEWIDGTTLLKTPSKSLAFSQAAGCASHLIETLRYALQKQLYYIDLHGDNLMINKASDITFIDLASFFTFEELTGSYLKESSQTSVKEKPLSKKEMKLLHFLPPDAPLAQYDAVHNLELFILCTYLDQITEMCIQLIKKSDLDRERKIELYAAIKKNSWAFYEDLEDNVPASIENYFDQLLALFKY